MMMILMVIFSLLAGWVVNVVADALPLRRSLRSTWMGPLYLLPVAWQRGWGGAATASNELAVNQGNDANGETENAPVSQPPVGRYTVVFCVAPILGLLAMSQTTNIVGTLILALEAWFFLAIAVIDIEHRLVLNRMLLFGVPFVVFGNLLLGTPNLVSMLLGGVAGFGFFLLLALLAPGAMGMGDVKLAGFIGLITGLSGVVATLFLGILAGGIAGAVVLIRNRFRPGSTIAYAPYLVLGIWFFLFNIIETLASYLALIYAA